MPCYRRNRCHARWNASAIRGPHALPRHSKGEFGAQLLSADQSHHRCDRVFRPDRGSDIDHCRSEPGEAARHGGAIMADTRSLVARLRNCACAGDARDGDVPVFPGSGGTTRRRSKGGRAAPAHGAAAAGKPLAATPDRARGHRYPRVARLGSVAYATRKRALVSPHCGLAETPRRAQERIVQRADACAGMSVAARRGRPQA